MLEVGLLEIVTCWVISLSVFKENNTQSDDLKKFIRGVSAQRLIQKKNEFAYLLGITK